MENAIFESELNIKKIEYLKNAPMREHTTFKIGGNADYLIYPDSIDALSFCLKSAKSQNMPVFILGNGSNILVSDSGIEGAVISLLRLNKITVSGNILTAFSGAMLSGVCQSALQNSLCGLEFAYGIPGTVGGALFMNAGAYGGEMKDVVISAECMDSNGNVLTLKKDKMALSYRNSAFKENGLIIISVTFFLNVGNQADIKKEMDTLLQKRKDKQPLNLPSAGSTFKRPAGNFAGTLIEKNGLKGKAVGGAAVSEKHAGFVVNKDNATAKDVLDLIEEIKKTVKENDGVLLEPEVVFVGRK